jgi:hypothetical protein
MTTHSLQQGSARVSRIHFTQILTLAFHLSSFR